jgi:glyoxylase-like metal-dependent hydrolase (beta-lactamase superfamily II)
MSTPPGGGLARGVPAFPAVDRHAWERPAVDEVTAGVYRIPLPLPEDVLRAVNVYAICGPDGITLIDGGWFVPEAVHQLERGLAELGRSVQDVAGVLTTHFHPDHYTLALELGRRTGAPVALGSGDRQSIDQILDEHGVTSFVATLHRAGVPADFVRLHLRDTGDRALYGYPDSWLTDGDRPKAGDRELIAISTPGHTRGHFCFADDRAGLLFAGDHVLPHITPSIGYESVSRHLPLADYLNSLRRVRERPDAVLLPAHGPVSPSVHARVDELLHHHDVRLARCVDALAAGARTVYDVAQRLPWTRRERTLFELSPMDQLMAVHETRAHLDVLEMRGQVARADGDDVDEYTATGS